jgi:signal transduction histidine kinase
MSRASPGRHWSRSLPCRLWPGSLFGRLILILLSGLTLAHGLSLALIVYERTEAARAVMFYYVGRDVASSVALLERLPAAERPLWLERLARANYRYVLGPAGGEPVSEAARSSPSARTASPTPATESTAATGAPVKLTQAVSAALGERYPLRASVAPPNQLALATRLTDGTPLSVVLTPSGMNISPRLPALLLLQLAIVALCTWFAVRLVTRPLERLASAADAIAPARFSLDDANRQRHAANGPASNEARPHLAVFTDNARNGPATTTAPLSETGPDEVVRAAVAFNAMQARIDHHVAERMQILAAVSHDLQTPITRMRLRADLLDDSQQRDHLLADLHNMQTLVEEGIAYARNAHGVAEAPCRTDLDALLASMAYDYQDAGANVTLVGQLGRPLITRPQALRRILGNLLDNAIKFGDEVQVTIRTGAANRDATPGSAETDAATPSSDASPPVDAAMDGVAITISDRGPGIAADELEAVFQPFYRLETSRNRSTGGTGLGLAIVHQLTTALGGTVHLVNRDGGGLQAQLWLPAAQLAASPDRR